jgi:hypothetical protein
MEREFAERERSARSGSKQKAGSAPPVREADEELRRSREAVKRSRETLRRLDDLLRPKHDR